ncbi:hypothetical protein Pmani_039490 [Petrolisthes manimaculis]|uniref:Uncharacterized protein n=1 Tax=Petrolisthes manimaculis TaxID=1843537 RepID=A0AAE1NCD6_9EUCA|nr:hypothetical protein Pmani_039490 [Petrolisthes manimaculis]
MVGSVCGTGTESQLGTAQAPQLQRYSHLPVFLSHIFSLQSVLGLVSVFGCHGCHAGSLGRRVSVAPDFPRAFECVSRVWCQRQECVVAWRALVWPCDRRGRTAATVRVSKPRARNPIQRREWEGGVYRMERGGGWLCVG